MSRTIPSGLATEIAAETTRIASCWKITRPDGTVYGFTNHDVDLIFDGLTYEAGTALAASALNAQSGMAPDNAEASGALESSRITEADLRAGRWDGAAYELFLVNWAALSDGRVLLSTGELGEISRTRYSFKAELMSLSTRLGVTIGRQTIATCDATLGDSRCGVNLASFTTSAVPVTATTSQRDLTAASLAQAAHYFDFGKLTWTTGLNAGLVFEIDLHTTGGVLRLKLPCPWTISAGDEFSIIAGCGKTLAICRDTFSNVVNFRGAPYVPGIDKVIQVGRADA